MSSDRNNDPIYVIPDEDQIDEMGYHIHIHIHKPPTPPPNSQLSAPTTTPEPTRKKGGSHLKSKHGKKVVVIADEGLGRSPSMTTCTSCQQQVTTDVTYKVGKFAKLICLLIVILGLLMCLTPLFLLPIPLCVKKCKDAYHSCPNCRTVLHVDKKKGCK